VSRPTSRRTPSIVEQFNDLRQDYAAAKPSRFKRVRTGIARGGSHADYHIRNDWDYLRMMEDSRDMDRCDCLIGHLLETATNLTLMGGIDVQAKTGDKDLDKALESDWYEWGADPDECDAAGELTFAQMQKIAFRQSLCDGDIWGLLLEEGQVQHVEGHRVRTPSGTKRNVVHGVMLDDMRRRKEVWVTREDIDPSQALRNVGDVERFPIRDDSGRRIVVQVYDPKRVSQTRGITALAPVFDACGQYEDITFAKLIQQQAVSCWAIIKERTADYEGTIDPVTGERTRTTRADGSTKTTEGLHPGMTYEGEVGETLKGFPSGVPNPEYFPHMKMTLQVISINLGVPLIVLLMDASETNFSGWRGAFDIGKQHWGANQDRFCVQYVGPIWRWRVDQAAARSPFIRQKIKALADPRAVYGCNFLKPVWPYIQPLQDATTALLELRNGHTSPQRFHASRNQSAEEILEECLSFDSKAIEKAIALADEINRKHSGSEPKVTWRDLYAKAPPDGVNVSVAVNPADNGGGKPNAA
jgi:capsid protein